LAGKREEVAPDEREVYLEEYARKLVNKLEAKIVELEKANAELRELDRLKSEFVSTVSHELRTPLNIIIGHAEILLDLSRIESGKLELDMQPFDVAQAVDEVRALLDPLAERKEIRVVVRIDPDLQQIVADRLRFKQILYNLMSNAVKFTPNGGRVDVTVEQLPDGWVQIVVRDTGIGIPKEHLETIFERFRQLDSSFSREWEGTGLGLALTREFVRLHGGKIEVQSQVGKGSTFTVLLPQRGR